MRLWVNLLKSKSSILYLVSVVEYGRWSKVLNISCLPKRPRQTGQRADQTAQGSYRQDCVKFKDFSRTSKDFLLFSKTENLRKILIYTLKFYF